MAVASSVTSHKKNYSLATVLLDSSRNDFLPASAFPDLHARQLLVAGASPKAAFDSLGIVCCDPARLPAATVFLALLYSCKSGSTSLVVCRKMESAQAFEQIILERYAGTRVASYHYRVQGNAKVDSADIILITYSQLLTRLLNNRWERSLPPFDSIIFLEPNGMDWFGYDPRYSFSLRSALSLIRRKIRKVFLFSLPPSPTEAVEDFELSPERLIFLDQPPSLQQSCSMDAQERAIITTSAFASANQHSQATEEQQRKKNEAELLASTSLGRRQGLQERYFPGSNQRNYLAELRNPFYQALLALLYQRFPQKKGIVEALARSQKKLVRAVEKLLAIKDEIDLTYYRCSVCSEKESSATPQFIAVGSLEQFKTLEALNNHGCPSCGSKEFVKLLPLKDLLAIRRCKSFKELVWRLLAELEAYPGVLKVIQQNNYQLRVKKVHKNKWIVVAKKGEEGFDAPLLKGERIVRKTGGKYSLLPFGKKLIQAAAHNPDLLLGDYLQRLAHFFYPPPPHSVEALSLEQLQAKRKQELSFAAGLNYEPDEQDKAAATDFLLQLVIDSVTKSGSGGKKFDLEHLLQLTAQLSRFPTDVPLSWEHLDKKGQHCLALIHDFRDSFTAHELRKLLPVIRQLQSLHPAVAEVDRVLSMLTAREPLLTIEQQRGDGSGAFQQIFEIRKETLTEAALQKEQQYEEKKEEEHFFDKDEGFDEQRFVRRVHTLLREHKHLTASQIASQLVINVRVVRRIMSKHSRHYAEEENRKQKERQQQQLQGQPPQRRQTKGAPPRTWRAPFEHRTVPSVRGGRVKLYALKERLRHLRFCGECHLYSQTGTCNHCRQLLLKHKSALTKSPAASQEELKIRAVAKLGPGTPACSDFLEKEDESGSWSYQAFTRLSQRRKRMTNTGMDYYYICPFCADENEYEQELPELGNGASPKLDSSFYNPIICPRCNSVLREEVLLAETEEGETLAVRQTSYRREIFHKYVPIFHKRTGMKPEPLGKLPREFTLKIFPGEKVTIEQEEALPLEEVGVEPLLPAVTELEEGQAAVTPPLPPSGLLLSINDGELMFELASLQEIIDYQGLPEEIRNQLAHAGIIVHSLRLPAKKGLKSSYQQPEKRMPTEIATTMKILCLVNIFLKEATRSNLLSIYSAAVKLDKLKSSPLIQKKGKNITQQQQQQQQQQPRVEHYFKREIGAILNEVLRGLAVEHSHESRSCEGRAMHALQKIQEELVQPKGFWTTGRGKARLLKNEFASQYAMASAYSDLDAAENHLFRLISFQAIKIMLEEGLAPFGVRGWNHYSVVSSSILNIIGLFLDSEEPLKDCGREVLTKAICWGKITQEDLYTETGFNRSIIWRTKNTSRDKFAQLEEAVFETRIFYEEAGTVSLEEGFRVFWRLFKQYLERLTECFKSQKLPADPEERSLLTLGEAILNGSINDDSLVASFLAATRTIVQEHEKYRPALLSYLPADDLQETVATIGALSQWRGLFSRSKQQQQQQQQPEKQGSIQEKEEEGQEKEAEDHK